MTARPRLLILAPGEVTRDPRARRAAEEGLRRGLDVTAICTGGAAPVRLDGVTVVRTGGNRLAGALRAAGLGGMRRQRPVIRELRGVYRLLRLAATTVALVRCARRLGRFDIVHANDFDTLPAARLLSRRLRARLVYDAHEVYTSQEPDPPRLHNAVARGLESRLARRAVAVTTVSEPIAAELRERLGLARLPLVVLNCPPIERREPPAHHPGPLRAIYQGAMGPGRPLGDLLEAARHAEGVELTLRVVGVEGRELAAEIAQSGLSGCVTMADVVPPDELVTALHGFDVGVIINRPVTRNDELVFPNKLFEYLMAGLAVVVPRLPGMTPLVEGDRVGVTFAPGQPEALGRALADLARDRDRLAELRRRARGLALERYNAEAQGPVLAKAWGL